MKIDTLLVLRLTAETKEEAMSMPAVHQDLQQKIDLGLQPGQALQLGPETQVRFRLVPGGPWE